jgi:hypothetical protein
MLKYSSRKRLSPAEQRSLGRVPADAGGSRPYLLRAGLRAYDQVAKIWRKKKKEF